MGSLKMGQDPHRGIVPRPFRARMGGLLFALAVVVAVIWLLSRVQ